MNRTLLQALAAVGGLGWAACMALGQAGLGWTLFAAGFLAFCFATRLSLNWQITIGVVLGGLGGAVSYAGWLPSIEAIEPIGRLFVAALKMMIAPMILLSIVVGIGRLAGGAQLARIGGRTVVLYLSTMACAIAVGLVAVNLFEPGAGGALRESALFQDRVADFNESVATGRIPQEAPDLGTFLLTTLKQVLANPIGSLAQGRILPIVLFAVLFGLALVRLGDRARALVDPLSVALDAVMTIIGWFVRLSPVGILALLGALAASEGLFEIARQLADLCVVVFVATAFHAFVVLPLFARFLAGVSFGELFGAIRESMVVAFTTSSSVATLPITTRNVEEGLGVPRRVSSFVLPLGATVNMDGTALYEAIAAVFVANVYGYDLSLGSQLVIFVVAMLAAVGAPGIPSAGMVTMIVVLESVGLPAEAVGVLLAIDRFLDTFRTAANVEGDAVVAVCVARAEAADAAGPASLDPQVE